MDVPAFTGEISAKNGANRLLCFVVSHWWGPGIPKPSGLERFRKTILFCGSGSCCFFYLYIGPDESGKTLGK